ncbi:His/Gly/Thr/Pro-type tRNA ligase C-terminal domain-containing protein, partial [uncultured Campylobacter sp.]|uniref:His/Gly/Thr/Pro-type tRNA ligase C-terminal domain-containing protein n=1 Tax=uncultured Campylobacter sp. TaxID=218934 RepID=UPI002626667B
DRAERFGVKMNDFELMGFPYAVLAGKALAEGSVEFITRAGLKRQSVSADEILKLIEKKLAEKN